MAINIDIYLIDNNIANIDFTLPSGISNHTLSINVDDGAIISEIDINVPTSGISPNELTINLENPLDTATLELDLIPPSPSSSPNIESPFIKICGFTIDALFINGTYSYWGVYNDRSYWTNPNGYYLKFDTTINHYILSIEENPPLYYLNGTNQPVGSSWKDIATNNTITGANSSIDTDPFTPCS